MQENNNLHMELMKIKESAGGQDNNDEVGHLNNELQNLSYLTQQKDGKIM
jgi:hypothetical protein